MLQSHLRHRALPYMHWQTTYTYRKIVQPLHARADCTSCDTRAYPTRLASFIIRVARVRYRALRILSQTPRVTPCYLPQPCCQHLKMARLKSARGASGELWPHQNPFLRPGCAGEGASASSPGRKLMRGPSQHRSWCGCPWSPARGRRSERWPRAPQAFSGDG